MATDPTAPKTLSPLKRFIGFAVLLGIMLVCGGFGILTRMREGGPGPSAVAGAPVIAHVIIAVIGAFVLVGGALVYGLVIATRCFTFNFTAPVYRILKMKLWVAHLAVGLFVTVGVGLMMAAPVVLALAPVMPAAAAGLIAFFVPIIALQFVLAWLNLWAPLELSVIRRRLLALGVAPEVQAQGIPVGLSDPSKSSWRKYGMIEEDLGMLWLHPDGLLYRGDNSGWDLPRRGVVAIERVADSGSTSSYFGASFVVLRFIDAYGRESRIKFHTEGDWTLTGRARRLNELAEKLQAWKDTVPATSAPPTSPPPAAPSPPAAEPAQP